MESFTYIEHALVQVVLLRLLIADAALYSDAAAVVQLDPIYQAMLVLVTQQTCGKNVVQAMVSLLAAPPAATAPAGVARPPLDQRVATHLLREQRQLSSLLSAR